MLDRPLRFKMPGKLIMGAGTSQLLGECLTEQGARRVLLVADPGVVRAGIVTNIQNFLSLAGVSHELYDGVEPDPRLEIVAECADAAARSKADAVVGLGGGSSLDIAKLAALVARYNEPIQNYFGIGKTPGRGLPTIMIPTTAGTGSEVTPIAVLSDNAENLKKGIVSDHLYPDVALVDPTLMTSLPPLVTAYTGMDALTHAIEAYTNRFAQPFVDALALEAIRLVGRHLRRAVACGEDLAAREGMALASTYGGMCLGSVNTAAVHALAYPLGGTFHVPHGVANTLLLPYVMEFNLPSNLEKFAAIAGALGYPTSGLGARAAAQVAVQAVRELAEDARVPQRMRELKIPRESIPAMAEAAMRVTRLMDNNPRRMSVDDAREIYERAY